MLSHTSALDSKSMGANAFVSNGRIMLAPLVISWFKDPDFSGSEPELKIEIAEVVIQPRLDEILPKLNPSTMY